MKSQRLSITMAILILLGIMVQAGPASSSEGRWLAQE